MKLELFQVDAFTDEIFRGNPACVVPLTEWLPDELMRNIAMENAVAETAFFIPYEQAFRLRWFTPEIEMDLCGHATLATAHVLRTILKTDRDVFVFETLSGVLKVTERDGMFTLDLPTRTAVPAVLPDELKSAISIHPREVLKARDYLFVYDTEEEIRNIEIDRNIFDQINLDPGGLIVTAKGDSCDFVSRYFTPQASIMEDPVTGSAHCTLTPFWSARLKKRELVARQLSTRGGQLFCTDAGERSLISGRATTYSAGHLWIHQK
jgi:PhzF family phenazine biosynthesis protein